MYKKEIILGIILITIAVGRFLFFLPKIDINYDQVLGKNVSFSGVINDLPDNRIYNQRLTIRPQNKNFNILITTDIYTDFSYGDKVKIIGKLEKPENLAMNWL